MQQFYLVFYCDKKQCHFILYQLTKLDFLVVSEVVRLEKLFCSNYVISSISPTLMVKLEICAEI